MLNSRFRTTAWSLVLAALVVFQVHAGTIPTLTEAQVLTWDSTTALPSGAGFGAKIAVGKAATGTAFAVISAPGAGTAQLFVLGTFATLWQSVPPIQPPSTSQGLPVAFDAYAVYAALEPGGTTSSIRRADTNFELLSGIEGELQALAMSGNTLVIGDPSFFGNSGRVRIYERNAAGNWFLAKTFAGTFGSQLGFSLAVDGPIVAAGAFHQGANGAVHVYGRAETWIELQEILSPASGQSEAWFGFSVALDGDLLAVGSPLLDRNTPPPALSNAGGVYVYEVLTPPFLEFELQALLRPPELTHGDNFGTGVDIAEPVPGKPELLAGSPGEDAGGVFNAGAVYRYLRSGEPDAASWHLVSRMARSVPGETDSLGYSVGFWDGGVLAGAPFPQTDHTGSVLFFDARLFSDGFESGDTSAWTSVVP